MNLVLLHNVIIVFLRCQCFFQSKLHIIPSASKSFVIPRFSQATLKALLRLKSWLLGLRESYDIRSGLQEKWTENWGWGISQSKRILPLRPLARSSLRTYVTLTWKALSQCFANACGFSAGMPVSSYRKCGLGWIEAGAIKGMDYSRELKH